MSPTYAREILTPEFGFGFDGVLKRRAGRADRHSQRNRCRALEPGGGRFHRRRRITRTDLSGKATAKRVLLETAGLPSERRHVARPVIGLISRLTDQKGFDLIAAAPERADGARRVVGDARQRRSSTTKTCGAAWRPAIPQRVSATIGFDERLAHRIEAGADVFLMPSRYEPCGLNQMYSLRYGTVPDCPGHRRPRGHGHGRVGSGRQRLQVQRAIPPRSSSRPCAGRWISSATQRNGRRSSRMA